jgi:hypothetical protein
MGYLYEVSDGVFYPKFPDGVVFVVVVAVAFAIAVRRHSLNLLQGSTLNANQRLDDYNSTTLSVTLNSFQGLSVLCWQHNTTTATSDSETSSE